VSPSVCLSTQLNSTQREFTDAGETPHCLGPYVCEPLVNRRYGYFAVADIVLLWPIWFVADMVAPPFYYLTVTGHACEGERGSNGGDNLH